MKKIIICSVFFIIVILFIFKINNKSEEIRVRVIPNSNSEYDLKIKEEVIIDVKDYIYAIYSKDRDEMCLNIEKTILDFEELLNTKYTNINVLFEKHNFYNKEYNGNVVKNECVLTLLVEIGNKNGDNWWGSIYPDLLEVSSKEEVNYKSFIKEFIDKCLK